MILDLLVLVNAFDRGRLIKQESQLMRVLSVNKPKKRRRLRYCWIGERAVGCIGQRKTDVDDSTLT